MNTNQPGRKDSMMDRFIRSPYRFFIAVAVLLLAFFAVQAFADENAASGIERKTLLEKPTTLTSNHVKAKVIKVSFPPTAKTPEHTHEGPGPRYILKGQLKVTEGDKEAIYSAGEVFWETGKLMTVENVGTDEAELVIFEMAPGK